MHCCGRAATLTEFFTHVLIGSRSVSLPAHACQDLPPASHSGCGAGGLAGLQAGRGLPQRRSSPPAVLICRGLPPPHCLKLPKRHVRMSESRWEDKTRHTAARVATIILCFSLVGKDESIKGEIPPALVLKYPSISIMLLLSCLVF